MTDLAITLEPIAGSAPAVMPTAYALADVGYEETELTFSGSAVSYRITGERTTDGRWQAEPADRAPFTTRVLVRRPIDAGRFSGTVMVEWLNVSSGMDAAPDWGFLHRQLMRRGDAWIGVSAQKAGIDGGGLVDGFHLKLLDADRYAHLDHPGDPFSFDIFSGVGRAARDDESGILGGLRPTQLLAVGESQSAMYLTSYINAVDPLAQVYDGVLVHGRGATGAPLDTPFVTSRRDMSERIAEISSRGEQIRADARVPVMVVQSETDVVLLGGTFAAQEDGDRVRQWEIAGAAHADTYLVFASGIDDGRRAAGDLAEKMRPTDSIYGMATGGPINSGPQQHYVLNAAYEQLARWATGDAPPPRAPRLRVNADHDDLERDDAGIAIGGLRTPWVDVPLEVTSGLGQTGEVFSILFGTTTPLATARHMSRDAYLREFTTALDDVIAAGHLLADDRDEILAIASATYDLTSG